MAAIAAPAGKFPDATPLEWSQRLAHSEVARRGNTLFFGGAPRAKWDYTSTLFGLSLVKLSAATGDPSLADFGFKTADSFVAPDGTIRTYHLDDYSLDNIPGGKLLLLRYEQTHDQKLLAPLRLIRRQLADQPRTSDGGFWHKQRYPSQMWLDGVFMASPFLAHYGQVFREPDAFDEAARQLVLMDRHAYDAKTGLHYHAWDEKHALPWANKTTGCSPNFWGRAEGWYAMALVDCLDFFPPTHPELDEIQSILRRTADGIVRWQDPSSGLWWQVLDQGDRKGNYHEATASCMFVYALAKAVNRGYLPREKYLPVIERGYAGLVREFIRRDAAGRFSLTHCCSVAGLGYTNAAGRARDGSFDYYVSEPVVDNDLKGIGPFILAGIEVQQLIADTSSSSWGRDAPVAQTPKRGAGAAPPPTVSPAIGWPAVPAILARIKPPEFPAHDFPITDFGAKPGVDATVAIRDAIAACHAAGGGRVVVPAGDWQTGAIRLLSNVDLHVAGGATLRFTTDPAAYLPVVFTRWEGVECMNYSPFIYALDQENIAVTGSGTLDGQASDDNWWAWKKQHADRDALNAMGERGTPVAKRIFGAGHFLRPNFIQPYRCKNVLIEGVHIVRSPMWEIHPVLSTNVTVRGVSISTHGPNNDGCDPECCRDVLIEDCTFDTGDDCIAIKSGRNNDGRRVGMPSENLIIRRCRMLDGHGGVVLGSECSGDIRNVFAEDCAMDSPNLDRALRLKSNARRGGVLENIFLRRITIGRVSEAVLTIDLLYEEGPRGDHPPVVRHIQLDHITSSASPRVMYIRGFDAATIDDIRIAHSTFNSVTDPEVVQHAGRVTLDHVTINPQKIVRSLDSRPSEHP
ncbi:MAG TPA: glycoside hydrolase family 88 protein [Opitutus sp.]|nr:glycoside hydrolase family 88 protein [Opitutus sp.]